MVARFVLVICTRSSSCAPFMLGARKKLKKHYGGRISFCGGVDHQELLVFGNTNQVREKVRELKIFPTGLIVSPSHEAILPDIPPENFEALFNEVKK